MTRMMFEYLDDEQLAAIADRLAARTEYTPTCWLWQGEVNARGYGRMWAGGKKRYVHRVAWVLKWGEIPAGKHVSQICHNRNCINPLHLILTDRDGQQPRKLTLADVHEIRALAGKLSQEQIARKYGVTQQYIGQILAGKKWKRG